MKANTVAALVAATLAGNASAALLTDGLTPGKPSSLLLVVYDASSGGESSGKTYLLNTGLGYADIVNGVAGSFSVDLSRDPNFQAIKGGGANLRFNVVGAYSLASNYSNFDKSGVSGRAFSDPTGAQWGLLSTGLKSSDFSGDFAELSKAVSNNVFAYISAANVELSAAGATATGGPDSVLVPKGDALASFDLAWGGNFGGSGVARTATATVVPVGTSAQFFWIANADFDKGSVTSLGTWNLSADGKLSFAGAGGQTPGNKAPIAQAGADQSVVQGATVALNGTASSDPDKGPSALTYRWTQDSGPATVTLTGADTATAGFTAATPGVYVFKLTVSDGKDSATASAKVTVTAGQTGPSAKLTAPAAWRVGQAQIISVAGSQFGDKAKALIRFSKDGGQTFRTLANIALKKGSYSWKPKKTDATQQGVVTVSVSEPGKPTATDSIVVTVAP